MCGDIVIHPELVFTCADYTPLWLWGSGGAGAGGADTGGASSGGAGVGGPGTGGARTGGAGAGDPNLVGTPSRDTGSGGARSEATGAEGTIPAESNPPPHRHDTRYQAACQPAAAAVATAAAAAAAAAATAAAASPSGAAVVPTLSVLPSPPPSSLPVSPTPISDYYRTVRPVVSRVLANGVTDPRFSPSSVSALTIAVAGFAAASRLDYSTCVVPAPPTRPLSVGGTYVDAVPPPWANVVDGMWLFKVKWPPGSPPVFKARYVARGFRFRPSSADPSLFVRAGSTPFFILVYVDDLVFATPDRAALAELKSELQKRHTCTDFGLQITRDRAARTITLTKLHMVQHVLQRFGLQFSTTQPTPLAVDHRRTGPFPDEPFDPSGPYP
ncbi:unnamed protein product [Closterium sp. NIES-54]